MNLLRQPFPDRLISLRGDLQWPPRSPDLTPCDLFLWGYLKSRTIAHLKNNIRDAIANTPFDMLQVDTNFKNRLHQCIRNRGRNLPDVIFKTV